MIESYLVQEIRTLIRNKITAFRVICENGYQSASISSVENVGNDLVRVFASVTSNGEKISRFELWDETHRLAFRDAVIEPYNGQVIAMIFDVSVKEIVQ